MSTTCASRSKSAAEVGAALGAGVTDDGAVDPGAGVGEGEGRPVGVGLACAGVLACAVAPGAGLA